MHPPDSKWAVPYFVVINLCSGQLLLRLTQFKQCTVVGKDCKQKGGQSTRQGTRDYMVKFHINISYIYSRSGIAKWLGRGTQTNVAQVQVLHQGCGGFPNSMLCWINVGQHLANAVTMLIFSPSLGQKCIFGLLLETYMYKYRCMRCYEKCIISPQWLAFNWQGTHCNKQTFHILRI